MKNDILPLLKEGYVPKVTDHYYEFPILATSESLDANAYYFNNEEWVEEYLKYVHRSNTFTRRWRAALGDFRDKTVIDIGCGPGNLFANFEERPKTLIGVDVAATSLRHATSLGYTSVLADANYLPFKSKIADIVTLNATLHHTDNMASILKESARLVKPGGILIADHDPQKSAWNYTGLALALWNARLLYYRLTRYGFHKTSEQQKWGLACETHHKPGDGVDHDLFYSVLRPMGFVVDVYPHNNDLGEEIFEGKRGTAAHKYRLGNLLSGRKPSAIESAINMMVVARKKA